MVPKNDFRETETRIGKLKYSFKRVIFFNTYIEDYGLEPKKKPIPGSKIILFEEIPEF